MKSKSLSLALLLIASGPLDAQDSGNGTAVSMTIDFVAWGEDLHGLEVVSGKSGTSVSALAFRYSEPFRYSGPQILPLAFGKIPAEVEQELSAFREARRQLAIKEGIDDPEPHPQAGGADVEGIIPEALKLAREKEPNLAALVALPAGSGRITILLAPGPKRSLVPWVFDDDPSRHAPGTVRIHNLSPHRIAMRTSAKAPTELDPGKNFFAPAPGETFSYELAYHSGNVWKIQENNLISVRPHEQVHMLVLRSEASFFSSTDGSRGGFLQTAFLRRSK